MPMHIQSQPIDLRIEGVVLFVYGDESMDQAQQRVCAVAGLVGSADEWDRIEARWKARNGETPFHARDCESDQGDYKGRPHKENKDLYKDLVIMIAESFLSGFAAISDLEAERRHYPDLPMLYLREFSHVIDGMQWFADQNGEMVELCFDNRIESTFNATLMYAQTRAAHPGWDQRLSSKLVFDCSEKNPRLQVADLFAYEAMKWLDNQSGPIKRTPRKSWLALKGAGRFVLDLFDESFFATEKLVWNELPGLGKARYLEYVDWLNKNKRQHNLTNVIEFADPNKKAKTV
jgi:hypothetical protein